MKDMDLVTIPYVDIFENNSTINNDLRLVLDDDLCIYGMIENTQASTKKIDFIVKYSDGNKIIIPIEDYPQYFLRANKIVETKKLMQKPRVADFDAILKDAEGNSIGTLRSIDAEYLSNLFIMEE